MGCNFVDVKSAYDSVDTLSDKLCMLGVNANITLNKLDVYRIITSYIRDNNNHLHQPRKMNEDLLQGTVLSPLNFDQSIKLLQYFDAICFCTNSP